MVESGRRYGIENRKVETRSKKILEFEADAFVGARYSPKNGG